MITAHQAGYAVDALVLGKWFLRHQEADRDRTLALRDLHISAQTTIHIPRLAFLEVLNAVRFSPKAEEQAGETALEALLDLYLEIKPGHVNVLSKTNAITWPYKTTMS